MIEGLTRDADHVYRYRGAVVPGVTDVMRPLFDWSGIAEATLERKSQIGKAVHAAADLINRGHELDPASIDIACVAYVDAYMLFMAELKPEILASEEFVWHPTNRYAGQLDLRCRIDGTHWCLDIKTTAAMHDAVGVQTAAYQGASGGSLSSRRGALWLKPTGKYEVVEFSVRDDYTTFISLLNLHRWKAKHG